MRILRCCIVAHFWLHQDYAGYVFVSRSGLILMLALWMYWVCDAQLAVGSTQDGRWCPWQAWSCETPLRPPLHKQQNCHTVRYRECNCPAPLGADAAMCPGDSSDSGKHAERSFRRQCKLNWDCKRSQRTSKDAPWCPWSSWSQWDATCGNVSRTRVRQCNCVSLSSPLICVNEKTPYQNTQRGQGYETHQQFHQVPCRNQPQPEWCLWSAWEACDCVRQFKQRRLNCKCPHSPHKTCNLNRVSSAADSSPCSCRATLSTTTPTPKVHKVSHESETDARFKRNFVIGVSIIVTLVLGGMLFLIGRGIFRVLRRRSATSSATNTASLNGLVMPDGRRWCLRQQRKLEDEKIKRMPLNTPQFMRLSQSTNWCQVNSHSQHNIPEFTDQIL